MSTGDVNYGPAKCTPNPFQDYIEQVKMMKQLGIPAAAAQTATATPNPPNPFTPELYQKCKDILDLL